MSFVTRPISLEREVEAGQLPSSSRATRGSGGGKRWARTRCLHVAEQVRSRHPGAPDPAELAGYFTEDGIYHNMPVGPVQGRAEIEQFIRGFTASWTKTTWNVLNVLEKGDVAIAERLDRTEAGDMKVDLPCTGVFEIRDRKIAVWRDDFDMGTYARGMG